MNLRKFTWLAASLPLLACGLAIADDDKSAPASDAAATDAAKDKPAATAKQADDAKPAEEVKPAASTPKPAAAPLLPRLRGQAAPARRPAADAVRAGVGAALRAAGELQNADRPPADDGEPDERRPPPPPGPKRDYAPPGGFAGDEDNPPPPAAPRPPPPPGGRFPGEVGPPHAGGPPAPTSPYDRLLRSAAPAAPGLNYDRLTRPTVQPDDPLMQELNSQEAQLDAKARDLAAHYRQMTFDEDRAKLRGELADVVTQHFEIRQRRRQLELQRLETQLDRLRGAIDKRTSAREALIKQRTEQLLGEEQDTGF